MGAIHIIKETNALPAVCGRVCPQETQCEAKCILGKKGQPVASWSSGTLCRRLRSKPGRRSSHPKLQSRRARRSPLSAPALRDLPLPASLSKKGHDVTIYEALHKAGGVLVYGIPEFRLPKAIVQREVDYVEKLGAKIKVDTIIGQTMTLDELFEAGL